MKLLYVNLKKYHCCISRANWTKSFLYYNHIDQQLMIQHRINTIEGEHERTPIVKLKLFIIKLLIKKKLYVWITKAILFFHRKQRRAIANVKTIKNIIDLHFQYTIIYAMNIEHVERMTMKERQIIIVWIKHIYTRFEMQIHQQSER